MKSSYSLKKNKKGVFGLTSIQQFFTIILGIALLAYVIVVIMGTLNDSTLIPASTELNKVGNETGTLLATPYTVTKATEPGFASFTITSITNTTDGKTIVVGNYTSTAAGTVINKTKDSWASVKITYTYYADSKMRRDAGSVLSNTSEGISGFFSAINPVYSILAILVIILVLVVLVRVVTGGTGEGGMNIRREPTL